MCVCDVQCASASTENHRSSKTIRMVFVLLIVHIMCVRSSVSMRAYGHFHIIESVQYLYGLLGMQLIDMHTDKDNTSSISFVRTNTVDKHQYPLTIHSIQLHIMLIRRASSAYHETHMHTISSLKCYVFTFWIKVMFK